MELFGLYRATVLSNIDPTKTGRLQLQFPLAGTVIPSTWAVPCLSAADARAVALREFVLPPIGSMVWVMFDAGDPDFPIWMGCAWPDEAFRPYFAHEQAVRISQQLY